MYVRVKIGIERTNSRILH